MKPKKREHLEHDEEEIRSIIFSDRRLLTWQKEVKITDIEPEYRCLSNGNR